MASDLVCRQLRVWVGPPEAEVNYSLAAHRFTYGFSSVSESGLALTQGSLELLEVSEVGSLDPRALPGVWKIGQRVRIEALKPEGGFEQLGIFRVLNQPKIPNSGILTLDLGCILTFVKQKQFEEDASGIEVGTSTNSAGVARRLLVRIGVPIGALAVETWPYTISWPLIKDDVSSFVDQAGKLAWANNCRILYQDPLGIIRSVEWSANINPGDTLTTIKLGSNDYIFDPSIDPVTPVEKVIVSGVGYNVYETPDEYTESVSIVDRAGNYSSNNAGNVTITTQITSRWSEDPLGTSRVVAVRQPQSVSWIGSDSAFPALEQTWYIRRFDEVTKLLMYEEEYTVVSVRVFVPEGDSGAGTIQKVYSRTTYEYDDKETLIRRETVQSEPRIAVDPEVTQSRFSHTTTRQEITTWREERPDYWVERVISRSSGRSNRNRRLGTSSAFALIADIPQVKGDSRPPSSERWEPPQSLEEVHYSGEANWEYPGGPTGLERTRNYIVEPGFSNLQCQTIAEREMQLLEGRSQGYLIQNQLLPGMYWAKPLSQLLVEDGSNRWTFKVDALSWEYNPDGAWVGGLGVLVARSSLPVPDPLPLLPSFPQYTSGLIPKAPPVEPPVLQPPVDSYPALLGYDGEPLLAYDGKPLEEYPTQSVDPGPPVQA